MFIHSGDSVLDGPVKALSLTVCYEGVFYTAAITGSGAVRLVRWRVAFDASDIRGEQADVDIGPHEIREVAVAWLMDTDRSYVVTAVIDFTGELSVSTRDPNSLQAIQTTMTGVKGSQVRVCAAGRTQFVTGLSTPDGLRLDFWNVDQLGNPVKQGQAVGEPVDQLELVTQEWQPWFKVLTQDSSGEVEVQTWKQSERQGKAWKVGKGKRIAGAGIPIIPDDGKKAAPAFVALENEAGKLDVFTQDSGHGSGGPISAVAACHATPWGTAMVVTAVRCHDERLKLITWLPDGSGPLKRDDEIKGQAKIRAVRLTGFSNVVVAASHLMDGNLKLTAFRIGKAKPTFRITFTNLRCMETTEDQGSPSDEPYVVFFTLNLREPEKAKLQHTPVFGDVDETTGHRDRPQHLVLWGEDRPEPIGRGDDVFVLVAVMESDDSEQGDVIQAATKAMAAHTVAIVGSLRTPEEKIASLLKIFRRALLRGAETSGLDSDDDLVGAHAVRMGPLELKAALAKPVTKVVGVSTRGEQGVYELTFEISGSE